MVVSRHEVIAPYAQVRPMAGRCSASPVMPHGHCLIWVMHPVPIWTV